MPDNDVLAANKLDLERPPALSGLEIKRFRCFEHLRIEKLGRVNLIAGKNNVGKSALLEALRIYATAGAPAVLFSQVTAREEFRYPAIGDSPEATRAYGMSILGLFHGRPDPETVSAPVEIGFHQDFVTITFTWFRRIIDKEGNRALLDLGPKPNTASPNAERVAGIVIRRGASSRRVLFEPAGEALWDRTNKF